MPITGVKLIGGKINQPALTLQLLKEDDRQYAIGKAVYWSSLLKDAMKPKRWLKPTKNGTKVHFDYIHDQEAFDVAVGELQGYINHINEKYGLDLTLGPDE